MAQARPRNARANAYKGLSVPSAFDHSPSASLQRGFRFLCPVQFQQRAAEIRQGAGRVAVAGRQGRAIDLQRVAQALLRLRVLFAQEREPAKVAEQVGRRRRAARDAPCGLRPARSRRSVLLRRSGRDPPAVARDCRSRRSSRSAPAPSTVLAHAPRLRETAVRRRPGRRCSCSAVARLCRWRMYCGWSWPRVRTIDVAAPRDTAARR